jgi:tRNA 2-thiouridine synthesizing protein A
MPEKTKVDQTVDCIGLYCPEPVFRTRQEIDKMAVGQILEIIADDPAAEQDIQSLIRRTEQKLIEIRKEGSHIRFLIKKVK